MQAKLGDRSLFPTLEPAIYLNHAAISPISAPAQEAICTVVDSYAAKGLGTVMRWVEQREALRADLALLLGATPPEIGLVQNTSTGIINIANSINWAPGDRIVLFDGEFPANITPWLQAAKTFGLQITWVSISDTIASRGENLRSILEDGARVVALSAVQFQTGWSMPLAAIGKLCRRYGALHCVDAVQAAGVMPLDVAEQAIDVLTCGGHKWMMGVEGAGYIYVQAEVCRQLVPRLAGWLSHEDPLGFLFEGAGHLDYDRAIRDTPTMFEFGVSSALGYAALGASVSLLRRLSVASIFEHVTEYTKTLAQGLNALGLPTTRQDNALSGIVSVPISDGTELKRCAAAFADRSIAVSTPDGFLRFAPHWPNSLTEVDIVLAAAADIEPQADITPRVSP